MKIRILIAFLLVIGLGATGAMAASYTVYPTTETHGTGYTDNAVKTGGTVLAWGGVTTGTIRKQNGYFKFDVATVPDVTVPTYVEFHFYVNATNYPWYSVTPVTLDPNQIGSTAALLWADIQAEATAGYYNYQNEGSTYAPGWKMLTLGGTALTDITAAFAQDWFALGMPERDGSATYFLTVDGNTDVNIPYLVISDNPLYDPPTGLTCVENGLDVDLTWTNGSVYDSIEVYEDAVLVDTITGTDTTYTVPNVTMGAHCYTVCGIINSIPYCSAECCLYIGTCADVTVDLGSVGCPGTLTASGDTTGAYNFCGNLAGDNFYSFTVTSAGNFTITTCGAGTGYDTYIRLYDDVCCGNQIAFDDDDPTCTAYSTLHSRIDTVNLFPGTYYVQVEGYSAGEGTYDLTIDCLNSLIVPPSDLTCTANGADVDLAWVNNDTYDSIEVYDGDTLIDTVLGSDAAYTVAGVTKGAHCWHVCGVVAAESFCSNDCCLIFGYDNVDLLWDFEADDGGFVTDGTSGWQWGAPTYGPCFDSADGNVWATNLDGDYVNSACYLLDTPVIDMGDKGGYICIDHCYDTEFSYDGGVVWFTTDGATYANIAPLEGYDDDALVATGCAFAAGEPGFSGSSAGWVTDCWELTAQDYIDYDVALRFAFGSDSSVAGYHGWMIDNVTVYRNLPPDGPIDCDYTVLPASGTVPFQVVHRLTLTNTLTGGAVYTRRIAARLKVTLANGNSYNPWRTGFTNVQPSSSFFKQFPVTFPASAAVIGNNTFTLTAMDVTPTPYNQPPYPPSGTTCQKVNVVVANAP
jgi:hypothetical protein